MTVRLRRVLALAILTLGPTIVAACGGELEADPKTTSNNVAQASLRDLDITAEAAGVVEPILVVDVKSKASGEVLALHAETGDKVAKGALLAEIDPRDVQNALDQAKADLEVAQVQAATDSAQLDRIQKLRDANVSTQEEYEAAVQADASARAQLVRATTNLQLANIRMGDVRITAPISGTVISRTVEVGGIIASATSNVSGGTTLMQMADLSTVRVRAMVDETDVGRIQPGMVAQITVDAYPNRTFEGEVLKIEPQAVEDQNVTMFPVLVDIENGEGLLLPGMNTQVEIQVAHEPQTTVVPNDAVSSAQEAMTLAPALGISDDALQQQLSAGGGATDQAAAAAGMSDECRALMEKVRSGGGFRNMSDADRQAMRDCRPAGAGRMRAGGAGAGGQGFRGGAARAGGTGTSSPRGAARPGVIFVVGANGQAQARPVTLGVSDWEYTQVLNGIEPGEQVLLLSAARLMQQQDEMTNRIRERTGGPLTTGGGRGG